MPKGLKGFQKGHKIWLGKKHKPEDIVKQVETLKLKFASGEIDTSKWKSRKGKTYEEQYGIEKADDIKKRISKKLSNVPRNHCSEETKNKISKANKGHKTTVDTRIKISETLKKNSVGYWKGKKFSEKHKKNLRKQRKNQIMPKIDTSIEIKIQNFLKELKIEFYIHQYIKILHGYQCDISIPIQKGINQKTIIECDGDVFHYNPKQFKENDKIFKNGLTAKEIWSIDNIRTKELVKCGFRVIRLWECEIKVMTLENFKQKLIL